MTGKIVSIEAERGARGRPPIAVAVTLKEEVAALPAGKRGRRLADGFYVWLRKALSDGFYSWLRVGQSFRFSTSELREAFYYWADEIDLIDYDGNHSYIAGEEWRWNSPPYWLDISRKLGAMPGVKRGAMTSREARERGIARCQYTEIAPSAGMQAAA